MDCPLTLCLLCLGCTPVVFVLAREYTFIHISMTWDMGLEHCRQHHTDLASFQTMEQMQQICDIADFSGWAWFGLYDDPPVMGDKPNAWRWSVIDETTPGAFEHWADSEPNYYDNAETCVAMDNNGTWSDEPCTTPKGFLCFSDNQNGERFYMYIVSQKSWEEARGHCREHYTDLAIVESSKQNSDADSANLSGTKVWIGLYRVPWTWSDRSLSSFRNWRYNSPNYPSVQHCAAINMDNLEWDDAHCSSKHPVICQTDPDSRTMMTSSVILKTRADLTQSHVSAQILQKVNDVLKSHGYFNVKLKWAVHPLRKTPEGTPGPQCDNNIS